MPLQFTLAHRPGSALKPTPSFSSIVTGNMGPRMRRPLTSAVASGAVDAGLITSKSSATAKHNVVDKTTAIDQFGTSLTNLSIRDEAQCAIEEATRANTKANAGTIRRNRVTKATPAATRAITRSFTRRITRSSHQINFCGVGGKSRRIVGAVTPFRAKKSLAINSAKPPPRHEYNVHEKSKFVASRQMGVYNRKLDIFEVARAKRPAFAA